MEFVIYVSVLRSVKNRKVEDAKLDRPKGDPLIQAVDEQGSESLRPSKDR